MQYIPCSSGESRVDRFAGVSPYQKIHNSLLQPRWSGGLWSELFWTFLHMHKISAWTHLVNDCNTGSSKGSREKKFSAPNLHHFIPSRSVWNNQAWQLCVHLQNGRHGSQCYYVNLSIFKNSIGLFAFKPCPLLFGATPARWQIIIDKWLLWIHIKDAGKSLNSGIKWKQIPCVGL